MARLDERYLIQMIEPMSVVLVDDYTSEELVLDLVSRDMTRVLKELETPTENYPDMRRVTGRESLSDNSNPISIFVPDSVVKSLSFWLGYFYGRSSGEID